MPAQADPTQPVRAQPAPRGRTSRRAPKGPASPGGARPPRGRRGGRRLWGWGGRLSRIWQGSLSGGLGACVIIGSAAIGAIATIVTRVQPGSVLGLSVLAGTVAAALTVQPRTGRLIFPVPALSYLVAALVSGVVYDHSTSKTEIAVGAAQWIADGFFVMVLATLLAIALTTVRWFMWRRDPQGPDPRQDRPGPEPPRYGGFAERADPRAAGGRRDPHPRGTASGTTGPRTQPVQWPQDPQATRGRDQRPPPRPGPGPYNFSSGA